jgi:hypothetical protein
MSESRKRACHLTGLDRLEACYRQQRYQAPATQQRREPGTPTGAPASPRASPSTSTRPSVASTGPASASSSARFATPIPSVPPISLAPDDMTCVTQKAGNRHTGTVTRIANACHDQASSIATRITLNTGSAKTTKSVCTDDRSRPHEPANSLADLAGVPPSLPVPPALVGDGLRPVPSPRSARSGRRRRWQARCRPERSPPLSPGRCDRSAARLSGGRRPSATRAPLGRRYRRRSPLCQPAAPPPPSRSPRARVPVPEAVGVASRCPPGQTARNGDRSAICRRLLWVAGR